MKRAVATLKKGERVKEIEKAMDYIGEMIAERKDGEAYLDIYVKLEKELERLREADDTIERVRQRLARRNIKLAA